MSHYNTRYQTIENRLHNLEEEKMELVKQRLDNLDHEITKHNEELEELLKLVEPLQYLINEKEEKKRAILLEQYPTVWTIKCTRTKDQSNYFVNSCYQGAFTTKENADKYVKTAPSFYCDWSFHVTQKAGELKDMGQLDQDPKIRNFDD